MTVTRKCDCGQLVHYSSSDVRRVVEMMIAELGATMPITIAGIGTWMVPRDFIALHGFKGDELPELAAQYGWKKVKGR